MFLSKIVIENYKLLEKVEIEVEKNTTVIVGKNNSGKTSFVEIMNKVLNGIPLYFNDYPIKLRKNLYELITSFLLKEITFDDLKKKIQITSIKLFVDYSDNGSEDYLGNLAPFIIDIDESNTKALIEICYEFYIDESKFLKLFEAQKQYIDGEQINEKDIQNIVKGICETTKKIFPQMFKINYYAVNPNNYNDMINKSLLELQNLFPIYFIRAERNLDESEGYVNNYDPFEKILSHVFEKDVKDVKNTFDQNIVDLKKIVNDTNLIINSKIKDKMDDLVSKSITFGYPNADELKFTAETNVDISSNLINSTKLYYKLPDETETLPSKNNGLGYKNLIKIELLLTEFSNSIADTSEISIPLLFIEEPESHMHPQLQRKFIEYLNDFVKKISLKNMQIIITTHSSYIVNSIELNTIRYALKCNNSIIYKNLNDYIYKFPEDYKFLKKFLKIDICEVFFADKLILIEGTSERLLIPQIINNMNFNKKFKDEKDNLSSQYFSLIEIGGAHAYRFINFVNYLNIPTLILCDIDSAIKKDGKYTKELYSKSEYSTNSTIKHWLGADGYVTLQKLNSLSNVDKTKYFCHIEYQNIENGYCGRSLEESIINVNRNYYDLGKDISESELDYKAHKVSKTDFAIDLLINNPNFIAPNYIENGLSWLDDPNLGGIDDKL